VRKERDSLIAELDGNKAKGGSASDSSVNVRDLQKALKKITDEH